MKDRSKRRAVSIGSRTLEYFLAVAELGSVSRAATNLRITQPALSRQIKHLEEQLGVRVLVRHWRGVRLTAAGERLYEEVIALQRQFGQLCTEIGEMANVPRGSVTLALTPAAGEILVSEVVGRCRVLYPEVAVKIRQGYSDSVEHLLENGHVDLAVFPTYGRFGPTSPRLVTKPLLIERNFLVGPPSAAMKRSYRFSEIPQVPLIVPARSNGLRLLLESFAAEQQLRIEIAAEVDGMNFIKALVRKNIGYAILPIQSVKPELECGFLQAAEIVEPTLERVYVVAWNSGRPLSHVASLMLALVSNVVEDLVLTKVWPNTVTVSADSDVQVLLGESDAVCNHLS